MFKVGGKAVCIQNNWRSHYKNLWAWFKWLFKPNTLDPKKNEIVTIVGIIEEDVFGQKMLFLLLSGYMVNGKYIPYAMSGFRPLDQQFTEDVCEYILQEVRKEQLEEALKTTS